MLISGSFAYSQETVPATEIEVIFTNVPDARGKVVVALHAAHTFMKSEPLVIRTSLIEDGKARVIFPDVPAGTYGIISFHDKNDNDQIDMDSAGIPLEAYGVSNNPMSFGPPKWSDAKFEVKDEPLSVEIRF